MLSMVFCLFMVGCSPEVLGIVFDQLNMSFDYFVALININNVKEWKCISLLGVSFYWLLLLSAMTQVF